MEVLIRVRLMLIRIGIFIEKILRVGEIDGLVGIDFYIKLSIVLCICGLGNGRWREENFRVFLVRKFFWIDKLGLVLVRDIILESTGGER